MKITKNAHWSLLLVVTMFVWASMYPLLKTIDEQLSPLVLSWARFLVACLCILALMVYRHELRLPRQKKDLLKFLFLGVIGSALPTTLLVLGIRFASAATSAIIINANILIVAILAPFFLKEKTSAKKILGVILGLVGVVLVIYNGQNPFTNPDSQYLFGAILVLVAAISVALFTIMAKPLIKKYDGTFVVFYCLVSATIILTIANFFAGNYNQIINLPATQYLWLVLVGSVSTALPFVIWTSSIKYIGATTAASFKLLIPVFATIFSVVLFNEEITFWIIDGMVLTIVGIAIVHLHMPKHQANYHD